MAPLFAEHPPYHNMARPLAPLSEAPASIRHADSSLSSTLISTLGTLLPCSPALAISIGQGHGVLEAYLLQYDPDLNILGIDVGVKEPQYLPDSAIRLVNSTAALSVEAAVAEAWMFVYPKDLGLVGRYMHEYGSGAVNVIIWIGPRMDWIEVEREFPGHGWNTEVPFVNGLKEYEALGVWKRHGSRASIKSRQCI